MKIAYIVPSLVNKGPVIVVKELVEQMVAHSHQCIVYYFDNKPAIGFNCPTEQISIHEPIDFRCFDVIHSHGLRPDKFVYRFREYSGAVRYVSTMHNYMFDDLKHQYNWFVAQLYGRLWMHWLERQDAIVTLSNNALHYYDRFFPNKKLYFAYNTRRLDLEEDLVESEHSELLSFKSDAILIGVNALLTVRKGIDLIIRALAELPEYKLFVVGDGQSKKDLQELAKLCGVADRCYFAGIRSNAYRYLPYYDIFALPSRSEGFPLSLLEAAVYAKKCVTSDIPIIIEAFPDGEVEIFELERPYTIVDAIRRATTNEELSHRIRKKYDECYSPQVMYNKYLKIYNGEI